MHPQEDRRQRKEKHMTYEMHHRIRAEAFRIEKALLANAGDNFPMSVSANQGDQVAENCRALRQNAKEIGHPCQDIKTTTSVPFQA